MTLRTLLPALALAAVAAPAFAEPDCSASAAPKPLWEIVKSFEDQGGVVAVAKITGEKCYEIYGRQDSKKVEIYYDPDTGAELEREED